MQSHMMKSLSMILKSNYIVLYYKAQFVKIEIERKEKFVNISD